MISKSIYHRDPDERRVKAIYIDQEMFLALILSSGNIRVETDLPEDLKIRNVDYEPMRLSFRILVQSSTFPERGDGEEAEVLSGAIKITPLEVWKKDQIRQIKE